MRLAKHLVVVVTILANGHPGRDVAACDSDNAGLKLPPGFCASVFADRVGTVRHLIVMPNGDVLVAVGNAANSSSSHIGRIAPANAGGAIVALRDTNHDGHADVEARYPTTGGTGIAFWHGYVYFTTRTTVERLSWNETQLGVRGQSDTVVYDMPGPPGHASKSLAITESGDLYVSLGSATNACRDRANLPAPDPCPELGIRSGIWRYRADRLRQKHGTDGKRVGTGIRNAVALTYSPELRGVYALSHGRDGLFQNFPRLYSAEEGAENPAEELFKVEDGMDLGWPYCYYDLVHHKKVLAPEYGGDATTVGRCATTTLPLAALPAHWAPNGVLIYSGQSFPARYHGGAFVAFHGSWNRMPLPEAGYSIVFAPFSSGVPTGKYETFADGFAGDTLEPVLARHRPTGLTEGLDGSLFVTDDQEGRIYRIVFVGSH